MIEAFNHKSSSTKVCALVVTYNRAKLMIKCLDAIVNQTYPPYEIIIIDNHSSEDTLQVLQEKSYIGTYSKQLVIHGGICKSVLETAQGISITVHYYRLDTNYGGAGGFNRGMRYFAEHTDSEQIWLMDDDCQPEPQALKHLVDAYSYLSLQSGLKLGYICSQVKWIDNSSCKLASPLLNHFGLKYFTVEHPYIMVKNCAFVSVMFPRHLIFQCGLPIKEYFIWHDDMEYTQRIAKFGYVGFVNLNSIVFHCRENNTDIELQDINRSNLYKFKCGFKNELITYKLIRNKFPTVPLMKLLRNIFIAKISFRYKCILFWSTITALFSKYSIEYPH